MLQLLIGGCIRLPWRGRLNRANILCYICCGVKYGGWESGENPVGEDEATTHYFPEEEASNLGLPVTQAEWAWVPGTGKSKCKSLLMTDCGLFTLEEKRVECG